MTTLIIGCGYLGRRVGRLLQRRGETVFGTTRSAAKGDVLRGWGIEPIVADVLDPATLDGLTAADRAVFCVGYDRRSGVPIREVYVEGLARTLDHLADRIARWVYVSSTGVYGQDDGSWVDETSPTEPRSDSGRACLEAERLLRGRVAEPIILRPSGLYGPGRIIRRDAILRGEPIAGDPDRFLNLIHIDDAAAAVVALLDRADPGSITLASDDRPAHRREYYAQIADGLGAPAPRFEAPPGGSSFRDEANKRVRNTRLRTVVGLDLAYPDIRTGVPAALAASDVPAD